VIEGRDMFWLLLVTMLVFLLLFQTKPFGLFSEEEQYEDVTNFNDLHNAVDGIEELQELKDNLQEDLNVANARIKTLEDTDWHTKYELVNGELKKERDTKKVKK